ncbi:hypothetical protein RJ639_009679 [Escallonia herrerae]|uniref:GAG-pre-integrase domain-containing protein n=1 Tax=Escallonia herrerae TaxID=1293975 RepID=A0AA88VS04_9ASTE|nr:hypothetical protein RJ639_009679 [Escallonia herrerae]
MKSTTKKNGASTAKAKEGMKLLYSAISIPRYLHEEKYINDENSSMLWHRTLGHISTERIKRLVNDGVLHALNFSNFTTCVEYIKGKQTKKINKGSKRSSKDIMLLA